MADHIIIRSGDIVPFYGTQFRVLHVSEDTVYGCELNTTKTVVAALNKDEIITKAANREISILPGQESDRTVDISSLTETQKSKYERNRNMINRIEDEYGPSFIELGSKVPKPLIGQLMEEFSLSRPSILRIINEYLQSGKTDVSLLPKRREKPKPNPDGYQITIKKVLRSDGNRYLSEEDFKNFAEALNGYKSGKYSSVKAAYNFMIGLHYSKEVSQSADEEDEDAGTPTIYQFRRFVNRNLSKQQKNEIKTSPREDRNNNRVLHSNSLDGVKGPGDLFEVDALDDNVYLVSEYNPDQVVGRPTIYFLIDVYTRMIVAFSLGFNVNSVVGFTTLLMNLVDDKVGLCKNYGIEIEESCWPSCILPARIRTDRGSEMISDKLQEILKRLNIQREVVSGGTGSLKGCVEQSFHLLQTDLKSALTGHGLVTKKYNSNHLKKATLTISEYKEMIVNFIVRHNQKYLKDYPLTARMIARNIEPVPARLWEYGCSEYGGPRPIVDKNHYYFNLLFEAPEARLSRQGVVFKGLRYNVSTDPVLAKKAYEAGTKHVPLSDLQISIRWDPRSVDYLFYTDEEEKLKTLKLTDTSDMAEMKGLTFDEAQKLLKEKKKMDKAGLKKNQELDSSGALKYREIVAKAEKKKNKKADSLREERSQARQDDNRANSIYGKISLPCETVQTPKENPDNGKKKQPSQEPDYDELMDALS